MPTRSIYGDALNLAARMESLADGGGICVSGAVYEQIADKLVLEWESLGGRLVKDIAHPVRVKVRRGGALMATPSPREPQRGRPRSG